MDLSIEAIEADLALAEVNIGRPLERLALARAQVRATLVEKGIQSTEPILLWEPSRSEEERYRMAAAILGSPIDELRAAYAALETLARVSIEPPAEPVPDEDPGEIEIDDDDEDFFAEARKERKP